MRVVIAGLFVFASLRALKSVDKTVEFDIYPRSRHVNFEPPLERKYILRNLEWFRRWLNISPVGAKQGPV
jgi:hypothetical protein